MTVDQHNALLALRRVMEQFPHLRLTQIVTNATGLHDAFYVQDARLAELLEEYVNRGSSQS